MKVLPHTPIGRRDFISATLGTLGLAAASSVIPDTLLASEGSLKLGLNHRLVPVGDKQKPVLLVFLGGGMSHIDTFSPLPEAPKEIRGPWGDISTTVSGVPISEKLPLMSKHIGNVALLRNIYHMQGNHREATSLIFTGSDEDKSKSEKVPKYEPFVTKLGNHLSQSNLGYVLFKATSNADTALGVNDALVVTKDLNSGPNKPYYSPFGKKFDAVRHKGRTALLEQINRHGPQGQAASRWNMLTDRANSMLSGGLNKAFDLSDVKESERRRYGTSDFGNAALIAKRMLDAGAPLITINRGGWDDHDTLVQNLGGRLPELDLVLSTLLEDLSDRAIIVVASEFGRTPKMNDGYEDEYTGEKSPPGRDHWPRSNFMILAGPGIRNGVYGKLDNKGEITGTDGAYDAALMGPTILRAAGWELVEENNQGILLAGNKMPYYPVFS